MSVKFGLIGFGAWGNCHSQAIVKTTDAELVAIAAKSESTCQSAREAFPDAEVYSDYRQLLARADVDIVDIVLPSFLHHEVTSTALNAGKHVLLEKPMCLSIADCDNLIRLAKENDRLLAIGHEPRRHRTAQAQGQRSSSRKPGRQPQAEPEAAASRKTGRSGFAFRQAGRAQAAAREVAGADGCRSPAHRQVAVFCQGGEVAHPGSQDDAGRTGAGQWREDFPGKPGGEAGRCADDHAGPSGARLQNCRMRHTARPGAGSPHAVRRPVAASAGQAVERA